MCGLSRYLIGLRNVMEPTTLWASNPARSATTARLVSIAGTLRRRRICDEEIEACLQAINKIQCERPGQPEHIARIVQSSRRWEQRHERRTSLAQMVSRGPSGFRKEGQSWKKCLMARRTTPESKGNQSLSAKRTRALECAPEWQSVLHFERALCR